VAFVPEALAQDQGDNSIPLDHFYVDRQGVGWFRKVISHITVGLSTGYGNTTFKHKLDGFGILQNPDSMPKIFVSGAIPSGYSNWTNRVTPSGNTTQTDYFAVDSDTAKIGFKSKGFNIPLKATLHVEFDKYRIGGGYSIEYSHIGEFRPIAYENKISNYSTDFSGFFLQKYFGMIGGTVYRYYEYLLVIDANVGGYSLGKNFDKSVMKRGIFLNLGATAEREMSEYFRVFVRPSYELKSYKLNMGETGQTITHKMNAFYINIGATYRFPELRKCPFKTCRAQMNHAHGNKEYRSRAHPIYKKQNPHYGENYPNLIKYKGRNKYKLDPY